MTSKPKPSRRRGNRKRINSSVLLQLDPLPRGRKPATLQSFRQKRLEPWLDFANLLPVVADDSLYFNRLNTEESDQLHRAFVEQFASRREDDFDGGLVSYAQDLAPPDRRLQETFILVRDVMERCVKWKRFEAGLFSREEQEEYSRDRELFYLEHHDPVVDFPLPHRLYQRWGRIVIDPEPLSFAETFRKAIEGLEVARIRRCPVADCGKFFYAVRFNTGACNQHLARARVQRGRDTELRRQYEETRRINRLVRDGRPLDKAKAEVKTNRRKRRTVQ